MKEAKVAAEIKKKINFFFFFGDGVAAVGTRRSGGSGGIRAASLQVPYALCNNQLLIMQSLQSSS